MLEVYFQVAGLFVLYKAFQALPRIEGCWLALHCYEASFRQLKAHMYFQCVQRPRMVPDSCEYNCL